MGHGEDVDTETRQKYCKRSKYWRISNMAEAALFIYSGGNREGNYLGWRVFFFSSLFPKRQR